MPFEAQENKSFWQDIWDFGWGIPGTPEKFEKKTFVFNSCPLVFKRD